ncbi:hypothetical protein GE21DRAFT_1356044 [Neurospora crassa]|nr:hypothetical protein GE21DRAFT_1356044 [Neurospora crassa]
MCTFTRTAFRMCGHTECRGARCSPPILHENNRHELCRKTPIYLQCTKQGICTQCRTKNWEASMAKSSKTPDAKEQHGNKGTRSGLAVGSKSEVFHHIHLPRVNKEELDNKSKNSEISKERRALHGPRAFPGSPSTIKESWNLSAVTKPVSGDNERRVGLRGPRDLPTAHRTTREDWNLLTVNTPARRGNGRRLRLRQPNPLPTSHPALGSFNTRGQTACAPLFLQEVDKHTNRKVQEATGEQFFHRLQDAIPLLPMSYKPILTGRHPLHRPLPPIPDENGSKPDTDDQPPPVPPHVVLHRRKAITLHAYDELDSPTERCTSATEAPAGTYLGRGTLYSGW